MSAVILERGRGDGDGPGRCDARHGLPRRGAARADRDPVLGELGRRRGRGARRADRALRGAASRARGRRGGDAGRRRPAPSALRAVARTRASATPDVLQLDVVWTPELAAAGWLLPLDDRLRRRTATSSPRAIEADRWRGRLYALPLFVDVGMLYWRTDLVDHAPRRSPSSTSWRVARRPRTASATAWSGRARATKAWSACSSSTSAAFGGSILDADGAVVLDGEPARPRSTAMRDEIAHAASCRAPRSAGRRSRRRFAFQNGDARVHAQLAVRVSAAPGRRASRVARARLRSRRCRAAAGRHADRGARRRAARDQRALAITPTRRAQLVDVSDRARADGRARARRRAVPAAPVAVSAAARSTARCHSTPRPRARIIEHAVARPATPVYAELSRHPAGPPAPRARAVRSRARCARRRAAREIDACSMRRAPASTPGTAARIAQDARGRCARRSRSPRRACCGVIHARGRSDERLAGCARRPRS